MSNMGFIVSFFSRVNLLKQWVGGSLIVHLVGAFVIRHMLLAKRVLFLVLPLANSGGKLAIIII